jgi:hypothetical protein
MANALIEPNKLDRFHHNPITLVIPNAVRDLQFAGSEAI